MKKCLVAGVLILNKKGDKVLLLRHRKLGIWVYPGGHLEKGETPLECAVREAREETNADFRIISSVPFAVKAKSASSLPQPLVIVDEDVPYKPQHHRHFDMLYLGVANSMKFKRNDESTSCQWFDASEIPKIETFENVRQIIAYGFKTYGRLKANKL